MIVDYCITVNMGEVCTLVGQGVGVTAPPGQGVARHIPLLLTTKEDPKVNTTAWHAGGGAQC